MRTLILELCGIAGSPFVAGRVTSHTPKGSLFIGVASLFQSSVYISCVHPAHRGEALTEVTNKKCLCSIWRPFAIGNVVVLVHIEAKLLESSAELL